MEKHTPVAGSSTGKYLKADQVPADGEIRSVVSCGQEPIKNPAGDEELRWILYLDGGVKPLILDSTNIKRCVGAFGTAETDDWVGQDIVVYQDASIEYGGVVTEGVRLKASKPPGKPRRFPRGPNKPLEAESDILNAPRTDASLPASACSKETMDVGGGKPVHVKGYTKRDGTYVAPHDRKTPDAPATTLQSEEPGEWLVYHCVGNGGVVFDTVEGALYADAVHGALEEAKTWGEFRRLLPAGEWETVEEILSSQDDDLDPECRRWWEEDASPFGMEDIPGLSDGYYPAWRQADMEEIVPEDLLRAFGKSECSPNGEFWLVPHENAEGLAEALRLRGYHVEETSFLRGH